MVFGGQAGVTLSAPIFTGNKSRNSVKLSQIQLKQNEQGLESVKSVYKRDINQTFADIDASNARLLNMETQIFQATSANKIASSRYINGVGTHVDVLNTISNLQKAALSKINYQYQLCLSRVELARLAGVVYY
jgi:outer membrane protein TolC